MAIAIYYTMHWVMGTPLSQRHLTCSFYLNISKTIKLFTYQNLLQNILSTNKLLELIIRLLKLIGISK